ncbi:hypothetical protein E3P99_02900 [Wallemia hederae]|uniref:Palmitoyltransferase n=1 Tax=Wallemia hederae TaxID=1540922 RepID=A0A4T0FI89_9BASI|nr:hypothetical protein E3P99_02900 [Wallemia hederae]
MALRPQRSPMNDTAEPGLSTQQEPEELDIFSAAQRGDTACVDNLISSGKATANDRDAENITPLHWASINAQVDTCRYLLEAGAEVDAFGGELVSTPLQWAARNGHLYVLHTLIRHGADPSIVDSQGFNALHLVVHSSVIMAVFYMLQQSVPIDDPDVQGHTPLMWAAYQGDALSVDALIRHGAGINKADQAGLTPLHWATVRGNRVCLRHIIDAGADLTAKSNDGKTPLAMAHELKSIGAYRRALADGGRNEDGKVRDKPLSDRNTNIVIFFIPVFVMGIIFWTLASLPSYMAIPIAIGESYAQFHIVAKVLLDNRGQNNELVKTPFLASIVLSSILWLTYCWVTRLVWNTMDHPLANIVFVISLTVCTWNFLRAMQLDPGTVPRPSSQSEIKQHVEELVSEGRLNGQNFCIYTLCKKPLRSKYDRVTNKLVARFDHYCPWVWNAIGSNNHRQFICFLMSMIVGIIAFDKLAFDLFRDLSPKYTYDDIDSDMQFCLMPQKLCIASHQDGFLFAMTAWVSLQLSWTIVLLGTQLWQIARQLTSLEVSNLGRFGFMGGKGTSAAEQQGLVNKQRQMLVNNANPTKAKKPSFLLQILGLDRFTKGKAGEGLARSSKANNPFDLGVIGNCLDFWTNGRQLGVDWTEVYAIPDEGFKERRKKDKGKGREEKEGSSTLAMRMMSMARFRNGAQADNAYEPVRGTEQV